MGERGIKYYNRGKQPTVRVGFFYTEIILAIISNHSQGIRIKHISDKSGIPYSTVYRLVIQLEKMKRIHAIKLKVYRGPLVKHYILTKWKIK